MLARDHHRCTWEGCDRGATQVDAIVPSAEGGSHLDVSNLRSLCADHHKVKTEQDRLAGLDRRRAKGR